MGYSPWSHKESDTTEQLALSLHYVWKKCLKDEIDFVLGTDPMLYRRSDT